MKQIQNFIHPQDPLSINVWCHLVWLFWNGGWILWELPGRNFWKDSRGPSNLVWSGQSLTPGIGRMVGWSSALQSKERTLGGAQTLNLNFFCCDTVGCWVFVVEGFSELHEFLAKRWPSCVNGFSCNLHFSSLPHAIGWRYGQITIMVRRDACKHAKNLQNHAIMICALSSKDDDNWCWVQMKGAALYWYTIQNYPCCTCPCCTSNGEYMTSPPAQERDAISRHLVAGKPTCNTRVEVVVNRPRKVGAG